MPASDRTRYGREHRALRRRLARDVEAGLGVCWRCGRPIAPGASWHLGHTDDGSAHAGIECVPCNTSAGGRARAAQLYGPRNGQPASADAPWPPGNTIAAWVAALVWRLQHTLPCLPGASPGVPGRAASVVMPQSADS